MTNPNEPDRERALSDADKQRISARLGPRVRDRLETEQFDYILLDINMPEPNGFKVCREIRGRSPVPIMMLTVRNAEEDLLEPYSPTWAASVGVPDARIEFLRYEDGTVQNTLELRRDLVRVMRRLRPWISPRKRSWSTTVILG